jgi:uncharacterized protein (UPF0335 family)
MAATTKQLEQLAEKIVENGGAVSTNPKTGETVLHMPLTDAGKPAMQTSTQVARRMAREPSDTPLPLGDTTSRRGVDDRLRLLVERIERLEEEKKGIADDIRDVYAEVKAVGYDAKILRQIIRLRKMKPDDRSEMETILEVYKNALGLG